MRTTKDAYTLDEALRIWDSPRQQRSKAGEGIRCCRSKRNGQDLIKVCTTREAILDFYPPNKEEVTYE